MGIKNVLNDIGENYELFRKENIESSNKKLTALMQAAIDEIEYARILVNYPNMSMTFSKGASRYPLKPTFYIKDRRETTSGTQGVYLVIVLDPKTYEVNPHFTLYFTQGKEGFEKIPDASVKKSKLDLLQMKAKKIAERYVAEKLRLAMKDFTYADTSDVGDAIYIARKIIKPTATDNAILDDLKNLISLYHSYVESMQDFDQGTRTRVLMEVEVRGKQADFKRRLMAKYNKCVVTGCEVKETLDAAHILPYSKFVNFDANNGFILRTDIHRLYDAYLLNIDTKGKIVLSDSLLKNPLYGHLHQAAIHGHINADSVRYIQSRIQYKGQ